MPKPAPSGFSGSRVIVALGIGALVGLCLVFFFHVIITHTPADVHDIRIRGFYGMLIISGALTGVVIETTRQLQAGSSDPAYHHHWWER